MVRNIFRLYKKDHTFTKKNNFCITNKIKLPWFYSLYRNYVFEFNTMKPQTETSMGCKELFDKQCPLLQHKKIGNIIFLFK